ncbi:hypothetical protein ACMX25_27050 [Caballeronia sp. 15715]|jgi:hypothetical protein|uniref:hypothetical protein n=1 Tax=Caballeronia sp. 15715 TaxID=3391030 RepID=UPI0039E23472
MDVFSHQVVKRRHGEHVNCFARIPSPFSLIPSLARRNQDIRVLARAPIKKPASLPMRVFRFGKRQAPKEARVAL